MPRRGQQLSRPCITPAPGAKPTPEQREKPANVATVSKNVFFIDKTAVSAAGRAETRWDYSSVPVLPKPHGLNGIVE
jgi:hypothetical protein